MVSHWLAQKRLARNLVLAILLVVGAGGAWSVLGRSRPAQVGGDALTTEGQVATSPWGDVDLGATSRPYAKYFEPEFLAQQAERLDPNLDVDKLHPTIIRSPEGSLGTLFLDNNGEVVLAAKYPLVRPFSEGLAVVGTAVTNDRSRHVIEYGYIDRTGRLAIDPVYENAERFRDGLAAVQKGGRWGYIDREGRVVIPSRYKVAEEFDDGIARVWPDHDTIQFLDRSGKVLFAGEQGNVGSFSEGLLFAAQPTRPGVGRVAVWGYMDRNFRFVFRLDNDRFGRCEEFHDGRAAIELSRGHPPRWGFLSRDGKVAIEGPFPQVERFSDGLAAVNISRDGIARWGYIDKSGDMVIEPRYLATTPFSEGLAAVLVPLEAGGEEGAGEAPSRSHTNAHRKPPQDRWGFIDREGRMIIEPRFTRALPFENGVAHVHENPYIDGYVDKTGSFVWKLTEPKPGK